MKFNTTTANKNNLDIAALLNKAVNLTSSKDSGIRDSIEGTIADQQIRFIRCVRNWTFCIDVQLFLGNSWAPIYSNHAVEEQHLVDAWERAYKTAMDNDFTASDSTQRERHAMAVRLLELAGR